MAAIPEWLRVVLVVLSVAMFVGTLLAVPWLVVRLPPDYFVRPHRRRTLPAQVLRNALGVALVLLGILLLVLPGQGILTVLLGLSIVDLPFKRRLLERILHQRKVAEGIQSLRRKAGKPPLALPEPAF